MLLSSSYFNLYSGNELVLLMRSRYGAQNVLATDLREPHATSELITTGPFE